MMAELGEVLKVLPEAPWYPQSGPQSLAYVSKADELFFGGSAGGGKSDLILGLGMTSHINTLVLRLQSTQLTSFKSRVRELMRPGDRFQGIGPHGGILRTHDGREMEFSGCENFGDAIKKFRGRAHDLKTFDELPTIPENVYTFIIGWNRTTVSGQRCRVVSTGNPPSRPEEEWVLDYWKPWLRDMTAEPGELKWFVRVDNEWVEVENNKPIRIKNELLFPRSRTFIPARLEDNPILEETGYRQTLINMPEPYKSQLLYGDMKIGLTEDAHQLIPSAWVEAAFRRWTEKQPEDTQLRAIAVDAARGGSNRSVIAKRYGNWVAPLIIIPGVETPNGNVLAQRVLMYVENTWVPIIIDITGTAGGGLYDSLKLINENTPLHAFVAASGSTYKDKSGRIKMRNKRTEAYWRLRDALDPIHGIELALPPSRELKMELTAGLWYIYSSGAGLEEKDEITKKLGGHSPDLADAVAMTFMDMDATAGWVSPHITVRNPTFMGADLRNNPNDVQVDPINQRRDPWA